MVTRPIRVMIIMSIHNEGEVLEALQKSLTLLLG